jgi:glucose-6-phosphate 1-dehydrogenase
VSASGDGSADGAGAGAPHDDGGARPPAAACEPSTLVVFGATGDLARRKILPPCGALFARGATGAGCAVVGTSRDASVDDARFREVAVESVLKAHKTADAAAVRAWADRWLYFHAADKDLAPLRARVEEVEQALGLPGNRSFYLSLPPAAFPKTVDQLGGCGLTAGPGWKRLVVEKPFGRDLASARELNAIVHRHFDESQVYRIDHYLGKETVQNLLVFRFANAMFESVWDRDHVESVMITVAEELGVEERAGYYETAGALRDMVQSHLTQLMTLVAMEVPPAMDADSIRAEKLKVLRSVRPLAPTDAVLGQYEPGEVNGADVPGYRAEPGVSPDSRTETFAALTLHLENWRWQGVPFHLRTGKRMPRRPHRDRDQVPPRAGVDVPPRRARPGPRRCTATRCSSRCSPTRASRCTSTSRRRASRSASSACRCTSATPKRSTGSPRRTRRCSSTCSPATRRCSSRPTRWRPAGRSTRRCSMGGAPCSRTRRHVGPDRGGRHLVALSGRR